LNWQLKCGFLQASEPHVASVRQPISLVVHAYFRLHSEAFAFKASPTINGDFLMRLVKVIAALTSVVAAGCSVFAVSWIGLALLGY
jgi:hypothetical protein